MLSKMFGFGSTQGQQQGGNMHDQILGQAMQTQGGGQQQGMMQGGNGDLLGMAGLLLASGTRFKDALPMAAQINQQQQQAKAYQYKAQQEQHQQLAANEFGNWLEQNKDADIRTIASKALNSGLRYENVAAFLNSISPQYQAVKDTEYGGLNIYNKKDGKSYYVEAGQGTNNPSAQPQKGGQTLSTMLSGGSPTKQPSQFVQGQGSGVDSNDSGSNQLDTNADLDMGASNQTFAAEENNNAAGTNNVLKQPNPTEFIHNPESDHVFNFNKFAETNYPFTPERQRIDEKTANLKEYKARAEKDAASLEAGEKMRDNYDIISKNLEGLTTGKLGEPTKELKKVFEAFGLQAPGGAAPAEVVQKVGNQLVMAALKGMDSRPSDLDLKFVIDSLPNLSLTPEGNREIIRLANMAIDWNEQKVAAKEAWYTNHNKNLDGFDTAWSAYAKEYSPFKQEREKIEQNKYESIPDDKTLDDLIRKAQKTKKS